MGNWLTAEQVERLLAVPDRNTIKGTRDAAILALLVGAGLRRAEVANLNCSHIQNREGRWLIADLRGKHGRIRSVPIPQWALVAVMNWRVAAGINEGAIFRRVNRHGQVNALRISAQAIFDVVNAYTKKLGFPIGPHDLRRSFAKLAHVGQAPLEQIQLPLGHASIVTTEIYLGVKQNLHDAPCDHLGLRPCGLETPIG